MPNNPLTDAALAELDRLHAAATPGEWRPDVPAWNKHRRNCKTAISSPTGTVLNTVTPKVPRDGVIGYRPPEECKIAQYIAALHNAYPSLRQRILDAESRLADAERLRGVSSMPPEYVKNVIRASRGDRKKMREATARAETAEALVAGLRGALEEVDEVLCVTKAHDIGDAVVKAFSIINAALALTPASAGARLKAEALREAAKAASVHTGAKHWEFDEVHDFLLQEADRLTAEAEKEPANG